MNKAELIETVAKKAGITKVQAQKTVDATFQAIQLALKKGGEVRLVGFGTFMVSKRAATTGRNPRTGAAIKIPARKQPKFRAGKELKSAVNK
jgi:DNA-binding protein HU-beta